MTEPKTDGVAAAPAADLTEKERRKLEAARGPLDGEDRYKALVNAVRQSQDLIELADKKARFALVIMSALNALAVLFLMKGGASLPTAPSWRLVLGAEVAIYAVVAVSHIGLAIRALRPRGVQVSAAQDLPSVVTPAVSMRVLFHADIVARPREEYSALWKELRMDNLHAELSEQLHTLAWINVRKYEALNRLYGGLYVMTLLLVALVMTVVLARILG